MKTSWTAGVSSWPAAASISLITQCRTLVAKNLVRRPCGYLGIVHLDGDDRVGLPGFGAYIAPSEPNRYHAPVLKGDSGGMLVVSNGMDAPTFDGINVPEWKTARMYGCNLPLHATMN